jgi:putative flippase GtrA
VNGFCEDILATDQAPLGAPASPGGKGLLGEAIRFGLVGVANTVLGLGIIAGLDLGLSVQPPAANAVGYAIAMILSYALNRLFVFRQGKQAKATLPKFVVAMALAFAVNQLMLLVTAKALGPAPVMRLAAQFAGMVTYTTVNFVLCRYWVFRMANGDGADGASRL